MIGAWIYAALNPVLTNRVYANLPQSRSLIWPAIKYTVVSATPGVAVCGDGGLETAEARVQIDVITDVGAGQAANNAIVASVLAAMAVMAPPAILDAYGPEAEKDAETNTFRTSMDFLLYPSSVTA